jgi:V/A-type H+-transporting ATPase subunit G/H
MVEAIKDVLSAEKKAEISLQNAEAKKQEIIARAKQDSMQLIIDKQKEIDAGCNRDIEKKRKEVVTSKEKMLAEGKKGLESVESKSKAHFSKAVDYVMKEFESKLKK